MSKRQRVLELARELGYANQELVTKINDLNLGIRVSNVMTALTEDEVSKIKGALKKSEAASSNGANGGAAAPVKRRSKKAQVEVIESGDEFPSGETVGPVLRRKKAPTMRRRIPSADEASEDVAAQEAQDAREAQAEAPAEVAEPKVEAAPAAAVAPVAAPVAEAKAEPVVEATPEAKKPAPVAEAKPAPKSAPSEPTSQRAKILSTPPVKKPEPAPEAKKPEVRKPEAEVARTPEVRKPASAPESRPAPREQRPQGNADRRPENTQRRPSAPASSTSSSAAAAGKGAQVLGRIDLNTMQERLDGRIFEAPGGNVDKERRRKKHQRGRNDRPGGESSDRGGSGGGRGRGGRSMRDVSSLYADPRGSRGGRNQKKKKSKKTEITTAAEHKRVVRIEDTITVGELGREMGVKAGLLALKLMEMGMKATVNTTLDFETAQLIALEFEHTVENVAFDITRFYDTSEDEAGLQATRPPVVTVMGHVDHGKTSLLDAIRASSVTSTEAGGITQHIGAYTVETEAGGMITFLDTPGHEAFTALRARGAQATDIVVLVVAADDGVMPQTVEAINHSRDAGVPIIVAVNKIDKPSANPDRVKQALIEYKLTPEEWGGETQYVEVSALKGINITELVEQIALRAEVEELTARADRDAQGIVIESRLDTGRGPLATVLVQRGTLRTGDIVVVGSHYGRVRTMYDHRGDGLKEAGPSVPAEITGLGGVPEAGEPFFVVAEERDAKMITGNVAEQHRQRRMADLAKSGMDKLMSLINEGGERKKLKVIVKGDVQGSIEALRGSFGKIGNDEVSIDVIHAAVGGVTENDVNLAASSEDAVVIVGFNVRADNRAVEVAEKYDIQILTFNIIYDAVDTLRQLVEGMLSPLKEENVIGQAEVRETFHAPKVGTIAGCYVTQGHLRRNSRARLYRDGKLIYDSSLASLRRFKDDVREVKTGFECGTSLENFNDIKVGDIIEAYEIIEVAATL
ncbi:MAG: translation initiation factor IF-2 [Myxococcota bacterium]|nr:translation initiation factor IF-2 [Myxococcota bacterium]